jgi:hypothetical protein
VISAARDWELLALNDLDDQCFATPAIADSKLFLRTRHMLYCFAEQRAMQKE